MLFTLNPGGGGGGSPTAIHAGAAPGAGRPGGRTPHSQRVTSRGGSAGRSSGGTLEKVSTWIAIVAGILAIIYFVRPVVKAVVA